MSQLKIIFTILSVIDVIKWAITLVGAILFLVGLYLIVQKLTRDVIIALGRNSPEVSPLDTETPPRF
jgi:uncharacterized membrane protein